MTFNLIQVGIVGLVYFLMIGAIAYLTENGYIKAAWIRHPLVYVLSLGVYAGGWAYYGSTALAGEIGYGFLAYYLGVCGIFLLSPVLLTPLLQITRSYQLSSLADLMAFRYSSQLAGTIVTLFTAICAMPLLTLQIKAMADSIELISGGSSGLPLTFGFCTAIGSIILLFGSSNPAIRSRHESLIMVIAAESFIKLVCLLAVGLFAVFSIFGGIDNMNQWIVESGASEKFHEPMAEPVWRSQLMVFFAAPLVLPHIFHVLFSEHVNPRFMSRSSWGLPLFLLLISLPIAPILWAGIYSGASTNEYATLFIGLNAGAPAITLLAFIGGIAATSGVLIMLALSLSAMILNHIVLPAYQPFLRSNIYSWLRFVRRILIIAVLILAFLLTALLDSKISLSELGMVAFSGALHFLPGILATLYWPMGNRTGFIAGLVTGMTFWFFLQLLPLVAGIQPLEPLHLGGMIAPEQWYWWSLLGISANFLVFILFSLLIKPSTSESIAASACAMNNLTHPRRRELVASSPEDFIDSLAKPLSKPVAEREVSRALDALTLSENEYRPYALRRLRDQVEANLSGLMGPAVARDIVTRYLGYKQSDRHRFDQDIHFVENRLENYRSQLTGLAADLDRLRRYHRQTLENLPVGVCALGSDLEVFMWNKSMETITGISADTVVGAHIRFIPEPWSTLLANFSIDENTHLHKKRVEHEGKPRWLSVHKATIHDAEDKELNDQVIVVEDLTETQMLEESLAHNERLASIGRLAAGVAHEIGNPVTGIACLAQNLREESISPELRLVASQIFQQTNRINRIVQSLVNFARAGNPGTSRTTETVDLNECLEEAINLISLTSQGKKLAFERDTEDNLLVIGDSQRLQQVFLNLINNASDATEGKGHILINGYRKTYQVMIEISDNGIGIPADDMDHVFEPFFTTKGINKGTGLGLALVYSIIEEHYGKISIHSPIFSNPDRGTRVTISLPAAPRDDESAHQ